MTIYVYEKICINIFNYLCQITSEAFTLKASFIVDITLLGKKKQVVQQLIKGFWVFLICVQAEIIFCLTCTSRVHVRENVHVQGEKPNESTVLALSRRGIRNYLVFVYRGKFCLQGRGLFST